MTTEILLTSVGGAILFTMGTLHLVYTLLDVGRPRRFTPSDDAVRVAMAGSALRFSRGRTSTWDAWLGFNVSHSLGAMIFGAAAIYVPQISPPSHVTAVFAGLVATALSYLATGLRFWFRIPNAGIGVATLLFAAALVLHLANAS